MRLPAAEGDNDAADGERRRENSTATTTTNSSSGGGGGGERGYIAFNASTKDGAARTPRQLDKEAVFEWFGLRLSPAKRVEFMCGLLHMCQPLELRFLGSCLEDLARKDFHVLRDFEARANSAAELRLLADVRDPVVLSRLLVCLSLLGSKNLECAAVLYGTLSRINCLNVPQPGPGPATLEQLALLFAMASLHPAFTFHQREVVRAQLDRVEALLEERSLSHCACAAQTLQSQFSRPEQLCPHAEARTWPSCPIQHLNNMPPSQGCANVAVVHIEKIKLKEVLQAGDSREYNFEVKWSDSSSTAVTKSHRELQDFLLKLCKEQRAGGFEQDVIGLLTRADSEHREQERMLRARFASVPREFLQMCQDSGFFLLEASSPHSTHSKCSLHGHFSSTNEHIVTQGARAAQAFPSQYTLLPAVRITSTFLRCLTGFYGDMCSLTHKGSDNSVPEPADTSRPSHGQSTGRKAVAMVNPLVEEPEVLPHPPAVLELALTSCLPYAVQYSTGQRDAGKPGENKLTITIPLVKQDTRPSMAIPGDLSQCPLPPAFPEPALPSSIAAPGKPCAKASTQPQSPHTPSSLVQCPLAGTIPTQIPSSAPLPPPASMPTPSENTAYINSTAQSQPTGCNACGCRGTCGGSGAHQSPASFFLPAHPARQMFGPPAPFFQLAPSLCSTTFPTQGHQGNGTPLPFYTHTSPSAAFASSALLQAHSDHLMHAQPGYATMPQVTPFGRFYPPVFPSMGAMPNATGIKKSSAVSCYNCGMSGHYAHDCKQPSMDAGQPGNASARR
ncbi:zinc finger CCHC domain-containing protein 2 isoform X1 [Silurus meridionalis]|nr:zinc finger CCHC domain-containing protein 2 isoform X1 [Silurus meridionalis]